MSGEKISGIPGFVSGLHHGRLRLAGAQLLLVADDLEEIAVNTMTFGAPHWFWGLLVIPFLALLFVRAEQRGAAALAGIRRPAFAPATGRNGQSLPARIAFRFCSCSGSRLHRQSGATALRLHLRRCKAQRARSHFRGRYFAEHAFKRCPAQSARSRQTCRAGFGQRTARRSSGSDCFRRSRIFAGTVDDRLRRGSGSDQRSGHEHNSRRRDKHLRSDRSRDEHLRKKRSR